MGPTHFRNYSYSGSSAVIEYDFVYTNMPSREEYELNPIIHYYRGPDMGGGVGGINYACNAEGSELNYKHYNLRGDVIATTNMSGNILSEIFYDAYGSYISNGTLPADKHRANTKVEDGTLILDGHRYRNKNLMRFMSPDPLEYVDGFNCYAYCSNNPWGRFDPIGLADVTVSQGTGMVYGMTLPQNSEFMPLTMMKFNVSNIQGVTNGEVYTLLREVAVTVNGKTDTVVVATSFNAAKDSNLDMRVFLNDQHNEQFLARDYGVTNTVDAAVKFAIIPGDAKDLGMEKSSVTVADTDQNGNLVYGTGATSQKGILC